MRIEIFPQIRRLFLIPLFCILISTSWAQQQFSPEEIAEYKNEVSNLVVFLEYAMNVLGDPAYTPREKDVVINESYSKIFLNEKVQIEDDLDSKRDVVTNKDVQAYLKDVDFFFKHVNFKFNILDIDDGINQDGNLFLTVKMMRTLEGLTIDGVQMKSDLERYIEVNVDDEKKDIKIASIYTTKLSRDQELAFWWAGLSREWRTILGVDILIREGLRLSEIQEFSDSTFIVENQVITDTIKVIDYLKKAASRVELNLAGTSIVSDLKPLDQLKSLQTLDISSSSIENLFPIRNITSLTSLNCSNTMIDDIGPLRYSKSLKSLYITNTPVTNLSVIENFENLEILHIERTTIDSLPDMEALIHLVELNCGSTNLQALDSVKYLNALQVLDISNTSISNLQPLAGLRRLRKLDLSHTQITSLRGLEGLSNLEELSFEGTKVEDLSPIHGLRNLQLVNANKSAVSMDNYLQFAQNNPDPVVVFVSDELKAFWEVLDLQWKNYLRENLNITESISDADFHKILKTKKMDIRGTTIPDLSALKFTPLLEELDLSGTSVSDLSPVVNCRILQILRAQNGRVVDLSPLGQLSNLKIIDMANTDVADISPLSGSKNIDSLNFEYTKVRDISVLNDIPGFKIARFDHAQVTDDEVMKLKFDVNSSVIVYKSERLKAWWANMEDAWQDSFIQKNKISKNPTDIELHKLAAAKSIDVSGTALRNIEPVKEFLLLESLSFTETRISYLGPVSGIRNLKVLKCPRNPISDIQPLAQLYTLEVLDLNNTQIKDIKAIAELNNLRELTFSGTSVKDLKPLEGLKKLEILDFSNTKVKKIKSLDNLKNLKTVNCYNNKISDKNIEEFRINNPGCEVVFY